MFPLLTLDESTLFYWTLSDISHNTEQKNSSAIDKWAAAISNYRAASQAPRSTSSRPKTDIQVPSLTTGTSSGRSYAPSVVSNNVKIFVKAEPAQATIYNNGGLSDNDEIRGQERDFAINSPPKGKKRITSEVLFFS